MGRSESQQGCKKHENEKKLPGVCSSCLRERLSQLPASSNKINAIGGGRYSCSSSLSSSPLYPAASSSTYVPPIFGRRHRRASEKMGSISFTLKVSNGLKKSRSIAFITSSTRADEVAGSGKKKGGGFWSKLLWSTGKRNKDVLIHARSASQRLG